MWQTLWRIQRCTKLHSWCLHTHTQSIYITTWFYTNTMNLLPFWLFSSPVKFDMGAYTSNDESKFPVTLRISKTRLFLSAQNEDEPVLLKVSCPRTPLTFVTPHTSANDPKRQTPLSRCTVLFSSYHRPHLPPPTPTLLLTYAQGQV